MTLCAVIPVFRGAETVAGVVEELRRFSREHEIPCRAVLVEDASDDRSREVVLDLAARFAGVTAILMDRNVGQQRALYVGIREAGDCDAVATIDDDGEHPVGLLLPMLERLRAGTELCYAVPVRKRAGPLRRVGGLLRDALFFMIARGVRVGSYRAMTAELAQKLRPEPDGFIYLSAAALRLKPKADCIFYEAARARNSTYTAGGLARLYADLLAHYTPLRRLRRSAKLPDASFRAVPGRGFL
ncbi:MAG: glycosyltransferase [Clostridiales bacterium]|nr:glycosyltransferase [Clostridiales bacterium]